MDYDNDRLKIVIVIVNLRLCVCIYDPYYSENDRPTFIQPNITAFYYKILYQNRFFFCGMNRVSVSETTDYIIYTTFFSVTRCVILSIHMNNSGWVRYREKESSLCIYSLLCMIIIMSIFFCYYILYIFIYECCMQYEHAYE